MRVLGIESSCDETAAAVVESGGRNGGLRLRSNVVASSMDLHAQYGGVVPEIAARSHIEAIVPAVRQALADAACDWSDIDAIAVTQGAGLGGSLLIGVLTARTLALALGKPLYAVNHVEAHLYVNFLTESTTGQYELRARQPAFPFLGLIASGGHTQLAVFRNHFDYTLLGETLDDAVGEAFDKVAKILGLPYPGGYNVSKLAEHGNAQAFSFPKAQLKGKYDFSFSGLKTAVLRQCQELVGKDFSLPSTALSGLLSDTQKADVAASFQRLAVETVVEKAVTAFEEFGARELVIGGGVAANEELRWQLRGRLPDTVAYTDRVLCTDNGAMVAALGCFKAALGQKPADPLTLDIMPNLSM